MAENQKTKTNKTPGNNNNKKLTKKNKNTSVVCLCGQLLVSGVSICVFWCCLICVVAGQPAWLSRSAGRKPDLAGRLVKVGPGGRKTKKTTKKHTRKNHQKTRSWPRNQTMVLCFLISFLFGCVSLCLWFVCFVRCPATRPG